jgi:ADP-heptose:LPS heptosyltransferase
MAPIHDNMLPACMPERILIVRLSALGDVALATPALRALRRHYPQARIDWVVDAAYADLLQANPHLSNLIRYERRGEHAGAAGFLRLRQQLARQKYDLVVDLQAKPKTAALVRSLGAARVVGLRKRSRSELLRAAVGLDRPLVRAHAVDLYLEVLAELGVASSGPALEVPLTARMRELAAPLGPEPARGAPAWVGLAPGARWATKRWRPERFAEVGNALAERGHPILLVGGPGDRAELAAVRAALKVPPVAETGHLPVAGLLGALARLGVLVAGDSGPVHLADALGVPTVALFGPTSPVRWGPRVGPHRVVNLGLVCSPCSNHGGSRCPIGTHACMELLEAPAVVDVACDLLEAGQASGARAGAR